MISRRAVLALGCIAAVGAAKIGIAETEVPPAVAAIEGFHDTLMEVMKQGPTLGFSGRRDHLSPVIRRTFAFPLMTRLMVGPQWTNLSPLQQQRLVDAFSAFSIATYANRFDDYSGERFEVDHAPKTLGNGDIIVRSKLVKSDGEAIQLDYLLREQQGSWQIIDVYLSGTVSELATRRSEFSSVLRRGGPEALIVALQAKTQALSS